MRQFALSPPFPVSLCVFIDGQEHTVIQNKRGCDFGSADRKADAVTHCTIAVITFRVGDNNWY